MNWSSKKQVIVSGMRPTGLLHLGHYFGVLKSWQQLQQAYECYFFVADWHSLTTEYQNVEVVQHSLREMVVDWLAAGVSPEQCHLFIQSQVPEHAELHLLLAMITPLGWLERVPSYKELKLELKGKDLNTYGFLGYPLLQTADVALYKANQVPVGEDQVAHIEFSREVLRRFNHLYGQLFPEPQPLLTKAAKLKGTDGRKMSKSYDNSIYLSDATAVLEKKILGHYTDPQRQRKTDPGNPDVCPIFDYHKLVSLQTVQDEVNQACRRAEIGCVDCKRKLLIPLKAELVPFQEARQTIQAKPKLVIEVLEQGRREASVVAERTLAEANQAMGIKPNAG